MIGVKKFFLIILQSDKSKLIEEKNVHLLTIKNINMSDVYMFMTTNKKKQRLKFSL